MSVVRVAAALAALWCSVSSLCGQGSGLAADVTAKLARVHTLPEATCLLVKSESAQTSSPERSPEAVLFVIPAPAFTQRQDRAPICFASDRQACRVVRRVRPCRARATVPGRLWVCAWVTGGLRMQRNPWPQHLQPQELQGKAPKSQRTSTPNGPVQR